MSVLHCQDAFKIYMLYWKPLDDNASVQTEPGGWEAVTPHQIWVELEVNPIPSNDTLSLLAGRFLDLPPSLNCINETKIVSIVEVLFLSYWKGELKSTVIPQIVSSLE